jgi:hypothetical protein
MAQTQAFFDDIQEQITYEINKAKKSILIAVAWFTDKEIFNLLCTKASEKIKVELLLTNDRINANSGLDYEQLISLGGFVTLIGNKKSGKSIMHNKFCVIDAKTIITGSYNWSYQAQQNQENITVIYDDHTLAEQFIDEFKAIKTRDGKKEKVGDHGKILFRIEALKQGINLEDEDDIALQLAKLKKLLPEDGGFKRERKIIFYVEQNQFDEAEALIQDYVFNTKQITVFVDPEIGELKLELKSLELQIGALEDDKAEIERELHRFQFRHTIELGTLIHKILYIRRDRLEKEAENDPTKQSEYEEAKKDFEGFEQDYQSSRKNEVAELTQEEQGEFKALFRACSKLCHPDVVAKEHKKEASEVFKNLIAASERNDLVKIREIYENLKDGAYMAASEALSDVQLLHHQVVRMRTKVTELSQVIRKLRDSEAFKKVSEITDWDEYFASARKQFEEELSQLEES